MVWVDVIRVVLCFATVVICEKIWKWYQDVEIKVDTPKYQVGLPEFVSDLSTTKGAKAENKPEEETAV